MSEQIATLTTEIEADWYTTAQRVRGTACTCSADPTRCERCMLERIRHRMERGLAGDDRRRRR